MLSGSKLISVAWFMSEESLAVSFYFYLQVRLKESATMICAEYLPVKIMSLNFVNF